MVFVKAGRGPRSSLVLHLMAMSKRYKKKVTIAIVMMSPKKWWSGGVLAEYLTSTFYSLLE